jgi:hypothetical protein
MMPTLSNVCNGSKTDGQFGWKEAIAPSRGSSHHCVMRKALIICGTALASFACNKSEAPTICVPVLPGWATEQTGKPVYVIGNTVALHGREIRWNGVPIDEQTLADYTRRASVMNPIPFTIFDPGEAPDCAFARHIRDGLDRELPCRHGLCWQGSKAAFDRAPFRTPTGDAVP